MTATTVPSRTTGTTSSDRLGHELPDERGEVGHVRHAVGLARGQGIGGGNELAIELALRLVGIGGKIVHRTGS